MLVMWNKGKGAIQKQPYFFPVSIKQTDTGNLFF